MSQQFSVIPSFQKFNDDGTPLALGRVYTLDSGTQTHKPVYTDVSRLVPHVYTIDGQGGQYIALNVRGEVPGPMHLLQGLYDIRVCRPDGSLIETLPAQGVLTA
jgi:hypothetical protein